MKDEKIVPDQGNNLGDEILVENESESISSIETIDETDINNVEDVEKSIEETTKITKHHEAKRLIGEAKALLATSDHELEDCKLLLENDLEEYQAVKTALQTQSLDKSMTLLSQTGYTQIVEEEEVSDIIFEAKQTLEPMHIQEVHSGKFTGIIFSLIGGIVTFLGLFYFAIAKLGTNLSMDKMPSSQEIQTILGWFGTQVGKPDDFMNGGLLVGVVVMIVMILVYFIRIKLKENANLHFATKQIEETQVYVTQKSHCKEQMDKVDAHITDAMHILNDYRILLHEQNAKLERIIHFEGENKDIKKYLDASQQSIKKTDLLTKKIKHFITTPMSEEGQLSEISIDLLKKAKLYKDEYLASLS